jgi:hypothetical protein
MDGAGDDRKRILAIGTLPEVQDAGVFVLLIWFQNLLSESLEPASAM